MKKFNKKLVMVLSVIFIEVAIIQFNSEISLGAQSTEDENIVISTMSVYKDMDYTFLKTYNFGGTNSDKSVITINTAKELMTS